MEFAKESMVVIYDLADGSIVHQHQHFTPKGATPPDEKQVESAALEFAARRGIETVRMGILHLDPKDRKVGTRQKVDTQKRALVELPAYKK